MNIVIVGAGEVGTHLAKMLSDDNHDIVLLDDNEEKLKHISSHVDVLTQKGGANSINDLKEAGVAKADLVIAVTPFEERNIVTCILSKDIGAKKTIARIDNSEYLQKNNKAKFERLGIDELIYPESLAAKEIFTSLKQVGSRQLLEFSGGKLIMNAVKIRDNAPIVNKTLEEIGNIYSEFRAVAITRKNETIIPHGKDKILPEDIVYFVTDRAGVDKVLDKSGKKKFAVKNVMILGGSRIGQKTALKLQEKDYNIKIVEIDRERSIKVADLLVNSLIINADGRNLAILKEEGIDQMDAFVAVTGNSETNILSCQLAKRLGVRRTVAEVENLDYMNIAHEIGIGTLVNKKLIAASYIYRFTLQAEVSHMKCLSATDAEVLEFIAKPDALITKKAISDVSFPSEANIGGIIRNNRGYIVKGDTQIQEGDKVVVFALPSVVKKLEKYFK
ncbi:Trk system potassium transporter TrkA [Puteibacter caeruleilacunae]|nr:Trk system potassium transporter TrkA [Puteibacter caeruleilacunae]